MPIALIAAGKFLVSPLGRVLGAIAAVLILLGLIYGAGRHQGADSAHRADAKAAAAALEKAKAQAARTDAATAQTAQKAGSDAAAAHVQIVTRTRTLIQRVPYEIPAAADVRLPLGWLRLYNASLGLPEGSGPAGGTGDQAGSARSSDALGTIAGNNGECLADRDRLDRLQRFYEQVRVRMNGR